MIIFSNMYLALILFLVGAVALQYLLAGIAFVVCGVIYVVGSIIKMFIEELIDHIKEKLKKWIRKED
nr:MAG TPA: adhesion G protein-coupled receptor L3 [Caudoviricetes sp.]